MDESPATINLDIGCCAATRLVEVPAGIVATAFRALERISSWDSSACSKISAALSSRCAYAAIDCWYPSPSCCIIWAYKLSVCSTRCSKKLGFERVPPTREFPDCRTVSPACRTALACLRTSSRLSSILSVTCLLPATSLDLHIMTRPEHDHRWHSCDALRPHWKTGVRNDPRNARRIPHTAGRSARSLGKSDPESGSFPAVCWSNHAGLGGRPP